MQIFVNFGPFLRNIQIVDRISIFVLDWELNIRNSWSMFSMMKGMFSASSVHRKIILALVLIGLVFGSSSAEAKRPNIVFIFSDDHAVQAIGAYGSKINTTPNIDRLAKEGAIFENSFCANSICGPSRANILTGKHSHINGFLRNGNRFDGGQPTFPKMLQRVGYQTAIVGKWHLSTDPTGFNYWEVLPGQGSYYNPDFIQMDGKRKRYTGYCTDIITERTLDWLKNDRDEDKPFMLMCQHKAPHRNWAPAPRHLKMFDGITVPEPETLFDDYSGRSPLLKENEMTIKDHFHWGHDMKFHGENLFPKYFSRLGNGEYRRMNAEQKAAWDAHYEPLNQAFIKKMNAGELSDKQIIQWKYQRYIKDYLATIQAVDESVGKVLDYLDESGLAENTIVIYSADQGFYLGEHGWYDKRWMFEESLKMPFLIKWPGVVKPGIKPKALIQNIDYAPTFLEIAEAEIPSDIQGSSLVPLLKADGMPGADWRKSIYYTYYENASVHAVPIHDGVRTSRYKLMYFPRGRQWQMFDLKEDPLELKSVHNEASYKTIFAGLQQQLKDQRQFYDQNTALTQVTRGDEKWWRDRNKAKNSQAKEGKAELAFIGDSITQGWEGRGKQTWEKYYSHRNPINLGFSGDRTEHVIYRLNKGNLNNIKPKVAVIMIGTNNTGHLDQDPDQVAEGVKEILNVVHTRSPKTKILLLGVFPRGAHKWDSKRINNESINQRIRRFADNESIHYMDIGHKFLDPDGHLPTSIMPDRLHLNEKGYQIWAESIEPKLKELGI